LTLLSSSTVDSLIEPFNKLPANPPAFPVKTLLSAFSSSIPICFSVFAEIFNPFFPPFTNELYTYVLKASKTSIAPSFINRKILISSSLLTWATAATSPNPRKPPTCSPPITLWTLFTVISYELFVVSFFNSPITAPFTLPANPPAA